jgi:aspartate kinase
MQELAEAGARVLNAQAVEFAKQQGIAIYARATRGGAETIVRRFPARTPGRVVGVASETGLVSLTLPDDAPDALLGVLARLDEREVPGKQVLFHAGAAGRGASSLVLSLENLHDWTGLRRALASEPGLAVREGVGAVSAIGAGINASFRNLRRACARAAAERLTLLGVSTSGFRISLLLPEAELVPAVRALHHELVEQAEPVDSGTA